MSNCHDFVNPAFDGDNLTAPARAIELVLCTETAPKVTGGTSEDGLSTPDLSGGAPASAGANFPVIAGNVTAGNDATLTALSPEVPPGIAAAVATCQI